MANEFQFTPSVVYQNGTLKRSFQPGTIKLPQATKGVFEVTVTATTAETDLSFSGLGTPGRVILHNLESTTTGKTLNWGWKSSTNGLPKYSKLPAKDWQVTYYGTSDMVLRYKAASGSALVSFTIFEA